MNNPNYNLQVGATLNNLPKDSMTEIIKYLSVKELAKIRRVNKLFKKVVDDYVNSLTFISVQKFTDTNGIPVPPTELDKSQSAKIKLVLWNANIFEPQSR